MASLFFLPGTISSTFFSALKVEQPVPHSSSFLHFLLTLVSVLGWACLALRRRPGMVS